MIQVQAVCKTVGVEVLPDGNVAIIGRDGEGADKNEFFFVIGASTWPLFKEKVARTLGVGVAKANGAPPGAVLSPHDGKPFEGGGLGG